ncbi:hypothetical protein [Frankia sp. ACN1ag]|uniref:hypothetical protein n=1 Tax=Frankia sp. ACN1ag TaxID=102891 RepID=UPI0006DC86C0|nr:hypothetical protein [Frankia sp. ACN1ag]KQC38804.1 hypothetical protein UK82_08465 [Frankia sp. ACN1ag]
MGKFLTGRRGAGVAAAGLLGLGLGVGLGFSGTAASAAPVPVAQTAAAAPTSAAVPPSTEDRPKPAEARRLRREHRLAERGLHGEATIKTAKGFQVVDGQRGKVTAISATSISVTSEDGYAASYVIDGDTRFRADGKSAKVTDIRQGATVTVRATVAGNTRTATAVADPKG